MTREQYLELKAELKATGKQLRWDKHKLRADMKAQSRGLFLPGVGESVPRQQSNVRSLQQTYRYKHIFMSLLRGKTRVQIENNFGFQRPNGYYHEEKIRNLCSQYNLECDNDEHGRVISVTEKVISASVA